MAHTLTPHTHPLYRGQRPKADGTADGTSNNDDQEVSQPWSYMSMCVREERMRASLCATRRVHQARMTVEGGQSRFHFLSNAPLPSTLSKHIQPQAPRAKNSTSPILVGGHRRSPADTTTEWRRGVDGLVRITGVRGQIAGYNQRKRLARRARGRGWGGLVGTGNVGLCC
jgi:hypothetical protein